MEAQEQGDRKSPILRSSEADGAYLHEKDGSGA